MAGADIDPVPRPVALGLSDWVTALAVGVALVHLAVAAWGPYELHRDALLYLAMGRHLDLFRMDFPPFIALAARLAQLLGGSSVVIHLGTAAAHGALIVLAGAFARRAGGAAPAQLLAALVVATAPVYLRAGSLFQPVVFDQLWWTLALFAVARIGEGRIRPAGERRAGSRRTADRRTADRRTDHPHADAGTGDRRSGDRRAGDGRPGGRRTGDRRSPARLRRRLRRPRTTPGQWALLGVILGLGLLTKFTILVAGAAILVGILATRMRRWLPTPWPWAAAGLAFLIGAPSITGQVLLGWPFFSQFSDLQSAQLSRVSPLAFTVEQLMLIGPAVLIAVAGAVVTVTRPRDAGLRAVAWSAIVAFALMLLAGGKAYYIAPIWPALLGIGMAELETWASRLRTGLPAWSGDGTTMGVPPHPWAAAGVWTVVVLGIGGFAVVGLPMGLPFVPPAAMAQYARLLGITEAVTTNTGQQLSLPQDYADMLGWEALADSVTRVYRSLPPEDQARAVILGTNYGRAGAIDHFAPPDVPRAISPVGSYWFWGPGDRPGDVTIVVGAEPDDLLGQHFGEATLATRVRNRWGVPEERSVGIVVARHPIRTLQEVWPEWEGRN